MSELSELYHDLILDHGKSPRNFGKLDDATNSAEGFNPLCGDHVHVYVHLDDDGRIVDLSFDGSGCAICMASSSLMTMELKGHTAVEARSMFDLMHDLLTKETALGLDELGRLAALSGVRRYPMRVKCATLPWHTLMGALSSKSDTPISTE